MDPLLSVDRLSALPPSVRTIAYEASRGSFRAWLKLQPFMDANRGPAPASFVYLPILFANLAPSRFRSTTTTDINIAISMALSSMGSLALFQDVPSAALQSFWPRMWFWMQAIEQNKDKILAEDEEQPNSEPAVFVLLHSLRPLLRDEAAARLVHDTPGIHAFVARIWMMHPKSHSREVTSMDVFHQFVGNCTPACHAISQNFLHGCNNDPNVLAAHLLRHVDAIVAACKSSYNAVPRDALFQRLISLTHLITTFPKHELHPALLSAGIVNTLTTALDRILALPNTGSAVHDALDLLSTLIPSQPGYTALIDALDAGLLRVLMSCTIRYPKTSSHSADTPTEMASLIRTFAERVLPAGMVYFRVLSSLAAALAQTRGIWQSTRFSEAEGARELWREFFEITGERIPLLERYVLSDGYGCRRCDNPGCTVSQKSSQLKRCAGCHKKYYCSRDCQARDWKHSGHREECRSVLNYSTKFKLGARDEAFLHCIVSRDMTALKAEIAQKRREYADSLDAVTQGDSSASAIASSSSTSASASTNSSPSATHLVLDYRTGRAVPSLVPTTNVTAFLTEVVGVRSAHAVPDVDVVVMLDCGATVLVRYMRMGDGDGEEGCGVGRAADSEATGI
ncbi:hypothetical protein R3P38DRAFT_3475664 [Favolaschia claudopus]|uniref:phytol kinase n=1 Tax=Favolaschia claudopus TaxID=2862362 RepID=A0AAW0CK39_9AGAR